MSSPDIQQYVDLTLYDVDAQDIYLEALDSLRATLPEFTPREGSLELVLLQAMGLQVAETVFSINRIPSAVVEALLRLHGIERNAGAFATSTATFTTTSPDSINAGTRLILSDSAAAFIFTTDSVTSVTSIGGGLYANSVPTPITSAAIGSYFNNTAAGATLPLVDAVPAVLSVVTASTVANGAEPEIDAQYFTRARSVLGRLTEALVIPSQFDSYVSSEFSFAARVKTLDQVNQTSEARTNGSPGFVAVIVCGPGGTLLSGSNKDAIKDDVQEICHASTSVGVFDPCIVALNVTVELKAALGTAAPVAAVTAAITGMISTDTWSWENTLRGNDLIARISAVADVDYVQSVDFDKVSALIGSTSHLASFTDGANVTLTGANVVGGILYKTNTITLTWLN